MSDPTPDFSPMARHLADALNLPNWEQLNDSELEHLLEHTEAESLSEFQRDKIVNQARQLIRQWEASTMATNPDDSRTESPKRQPVTSVASSPKNSSLRSSQRTRANRKGAGSAVVMAGIALLATAVLILQSGPNKETAQHQPAEPVAAVEYLSPGALRASSMPALPAPEKVVVGSTIETKSRERKRVTLPDGSTLFLNENTLVKVTTERRLQVQAGELYVEVVAHDLIETKTPFVVETPQRRVTALGTKFVVQANKADTNVLVTQGKVQVSGMAEPLTAGQQLKQDQRLPAPRASEALLWTKDLMASAESPLVPKSEHAGGALVAVDPSGQEMSLSLRKQHIDVHVEDGFARTTIDQTYFNSSWSQMEGTFYFPLPPDASLSRLAMYVGENLMEGGMAERDHARNVFEQIRYTRRDPALLEWVDGSTFKMRVFPLEARQEKRLVISYTQRLQSAYGKTHYRFPAGHNLELIRDWSTHVLVKNHADRKWTSPSHGLKSEMVGNDLVLETTSQGVVDDQDLVIELEVAQEANPQPDAARFSRVIHEGHQYLMLRFRPDLKGELKRTPRNWVFLFESAGNRDSLLARVQIDVLHTLLKNAEHEDTFCIVTAATRATAWKDRPVPCTPQNVEAAIKHLNEVHLVGALNLENALTACKPFVEAKQTKPSAESYLVHLGAGVAVLGQTETEGLLRKLPADAKYVGIGVGKRWSQSFMKAAANKTGGHVTQINPDEEIGWRSFELLALLNSPRVLNVKVTSDESKAQFLQFADTLAQGEELCALTRLDGKAELPKSLTITGKLAGKPYEKTIPVENVAGDAGYLPRTWAKLEIDRLVAAGAELHKAEIIQLSKATYVMSPFTSLLVLENEAMYEQFKVDRGRKDHWALYPCPAKIPVVYEPGSLPVNQIISTNARAKSVEELLKTVLVRIPPTTVRLANGVQYVAQGLNVMQLYTGAIAMPMQSPQIWNYWGRMSGPMSGGGSGPKGFGLSETYFDSGMLLQGGGGRIGIDFDFNVQDNVAGDKFHSFSRDGRVLMNSHFGNVWWDEKLDGIPTPRILITEDQRFSGAGDVNGQVFGSRPALLGGGRRLDLLTELESAQQRIDLGTVRNFQDFDAGINYLNLGNGRLRDEVFDLKTFEVYQRPTAERWGEPQLSMREINGSVTFTQNPSGVKFTPGTIPLADSRYDFVSGYGIPAFGRGGFFQPPFYPTLPGLNTWPINGTITKFVPQFAMTIHDADELIQSAPQVTSNWSIERFGDLLAHAPGLNTLSTDVLALLESQGPANLLPKRGKIDPQAQALIDRARQLGWETVTLPSGKDQSGLTIRCDGQGRYSYERTVSEGLKERVLCDGESLLHLYEELGLGGRRSVSRFHRAELQRLIPWLVPPAEDLAVGCDVRHVNDHTIALVPLEDEKAETESTSPAVYLLMVFRQDGSLQERQLVESKTNKPLLTVKCGANGAVEVLGQDDKRLSHADWQRKPAEAPNLKPDLTDLVVLSMPHRGSESFLSPEQQQLANTNQYLALDEESAQALMGSYHAIGNVSQLTNLISQRYFAKEDHRIGLYVLLASLYQQTGIANPATQLTQQHPNSPLAEYLSQHFQWAHVGNNKQDYVVSGPEAGFVQRLAMARNLFVRWQTGQAVNNRSATEVKLERRQGLDSIKKLRSPELGWLLLTTMQSKDTDPKGLADYVRAADEFAKMPGLSMLARYQAAHWRSEHGETAEAVNQLEALSQELLAAGTLPPITEAVRNGFVNHNGTKAWAAYLEELQAKFLKDGQRHAALLVAIRAALIKKDPLSESLMAAALKALSPEKHPLTALLAVGYLMDQKQFAEAERLIAPLLKAEGWSKQPGLWRKASEIARPNQEAMSVARWERALHLEYETLPDLINLQSIRSDYAAVLGRMESLAAGAEPEADLKIRAIRLADRWRVLDPDDTAACQVAARILTHLGDQELAWDYLTTPLADKPNESAPWLALAQTMASQQKIDQADQAYRAAFAAESTNAQILWDHAEFLRQHDCLEDAQELLEKLANQDWQPRFMPLKTQAQQRLNPME